MSDLTFLEIPAQMLWAERGTCRPGATTDLFFPTRGESLAPAKALCRACPVIAECREWAMAHEKYGVWGGLSENERQRLRSGTRFIFPCAICGTEMVIKRTVGGKPKFCSEDCLREGRRRSQAKYVQVK